MSRELKNTLSPTSLRAFVVGLMVGLGFPSMSAADTLNKDFLSTTPDGYQFAREKNFQAARDWAVKHLKTNPKDGDALHLKSWMENLLTEPQLSLDTASKCIALGSHIGHSHGLKADAYFALGQPTRALLEIDDAIKIRPMPWCFRLRSAINAKLGHSAESATDERISDLVEQLDHAWDKFTEVSHQEKPSHHRKTNLELEYSAGQRAFARLSFQAARDYFSRVIELKPDLLDAYLYRSQALEALDQWEAALIDINHLIAIRKDAKIFIRVAPQAGPNKLPLQEWPKVEIPISQIYKRRARCYASMQMHNRAIEDLSIAAKLQPEDNWIFENRGDSYAHCKDYKRALADYLKSETLEPTHPGTTPKVIDCCVKDGNYKLAVIRLNWSLKNTPTDDVMLFQRAVCLSQLGLHKQSIADLTFILSVNDDHSQALLKRGHEYEALGELNSALKDYARVIALEKGPTTKSRQASAGLDRVRSLLKKKS